MSEGTPLRTSESRNVRSLLRGGEQASRGPEQTHSEGDKEEDALWYQWISGLKALSSLPEVTAILNSLPITLLKDNAIQPNLSPEQWDTVQKTELRTSATAAKSPLLDVWKRFWDEVVTLELPDQQPTGKLNSRDLERSQHFSKLLESLRKVREALTVFDYGVAQRQQLSKEVTEHVLREKEPIFILDPYQVIVEGLFALRTGEIRPEMSSDFFLTYLVAEVKKNYAPEHQEDGLLLDWYVAGSSEEAPVSFRNLIDRLESRMELGIPVDLGSFDQRELDVQTQAAKKAVQWFWNQHTTENKIPLISGDKESWIIQRGENGSNSSELVRETAVFITQAIKERFPGYDHSLLLGNVLDTLHNHVEADLEPLLRHHAWSKSVREAVQSLHELGGDGSSEQLHISWLNRQLLEFQTWVRRECRDPFVLEVLASGQFSRFLPLESGADRDEENPVATFMNQKLDDAKRVRFVQLVRLAGFAALSSYKEVNETLQSSGGRKLSKSEYRSLASLASAFNQDKSLAQLAQKRLDQLAPQT